MTTLPYYMRGDCYYVSCRARNLCVTHCVGAVYEKQGFVIQNGEVKPKPVPPKNDRGVTEQ